MTNTQPLWRVSYILINQVDVEAWYDLGCHLVTVDGRDIWNKSHNLQKLAWELIPTQLARPSLAIALWRDYSWRSAKWVTQLYTKLDPDIVSLFTNATKSRMGPEQVSVDCQEIKPGSHLLGYYLTPQTNSVLQWALQACIPRMKRQRNRLNFSTDINLSKNSLVFNLSR